MQKEERDLAAHIAAEVRGRRTAFRWSQLTLAERAGLSLNYIGMLERAERLPSFEVLIRIARALDVSLGALVSEATIAAPGDSDPWLTEATAILRTLPSDARPVAIGVLRAVAEAATPRKAARASGMRKKRGR